MEFWKALLPQKSGPVGTYRLNPFMPTVPAFAVREIDVSRHNGGTSGAPLKPLRDDSALRTLSSLRGLRGHPRFPHYAERRSLSDSKCWNGGKKWVKMNYYFLSPGDSSYPLEQWLLTPVEYPSSAEELEYNNRHAINHKAVTDCFRLLKDRFQCLRRGSGEL